MIKQKIIITLIASVISTIIVFTLLTVYVVDIPFGISMFLLFMAFMFTFFIIFDIILCKTYKNSVKNKLILIISFMGIIILFSFTACGFGLDFKLTKEMHDIIARCGLFSFIISLICLPICEFCKK